MHSLIKLQAGQQDCEWLETLRGSVWLCKAEGAKGEKTLVWKFKKIFSFVYILVFPPLRQCCL